jgi:type IV pilus assembly protein PilB
MRARPDGPDLHGVTCGFNCTSGGVRLAPTLGVSSQNVFRQSEIASMTPAADARKKPDLHLASASHRTKLPIGEVLVRSGAITQEQLQDALKQQKNGNKQRLGRLLVTLGFVTDETMRQALSMQLTIPFVDLERMRIDPALGRVINQAYARRHNLLPVSSIGRSLTVCMDDPTDQSVVTELTRLTGYSISVVTASHEAIKAAFSRLYNETLATSSTAGTGGPETVNLDFDDEPEDNRGSYGFDYKTADVVVRKVLATAVEQRCSDIHLEMLSNRMNIRFRVDGILVTPQLGEMQQACDNMAREMISRLKILAKLDIAERRRPQDGSFRIKSQRGDQMMMIDLRVSVVPSMHGESVVIRVLDKTRLPKSIDGLGLPQPLVHQFHQLLKRTNGIILVTGPTGSGKSTTLYSALKTVATPHMRILTAEDPIEYVYEQFSQCEVNHTIGNTFASYLRAFLRHDPEIIMVGEIRDAETAEMAMRAAQTGHLLLSTLHTTTAVEAVTRLRDLGIDSNTIASTLTGVMGQRLVRKVCTSCRGPYSPSKSLMEELPMARHMASWQLVKGAGCAKCNFTGYSGRVMVGELWVPSQDDALIIAKGANIDEVAASAAANTFSMAQCGLTLLVEGVTNIEELVRVMPFPAIKQMVDMEPVAVSA